MILKYLLRRRPHKITLSRADYTLTVENIARLMRYVRDSERILAEFESVMGNYRRVLRGSPTEVPVLRPDGEIHYTCERCGHVTIVPRE